MSAHPKDADFEAFVIGALEDEEPRSAFLAHVSECDPCAARLEREARVELAMFEVHEAARTDELAKASPAADRSARVAALRPGWRRATLAIGAIAAAAAIFVFHRVRKPPIEPDRTPMTMTTTPSRENATSPPEATAGKSSASAVPPDIRDGSVDGSPKEERSGIATVVQSDMLFEEGQRLMKEGKYDLACPKLEESHRLHAAGGTALNLGLCLEAQGKKESALSAFKEALAFALHDDRPGRARLAREHIAKLESTLGPKGDE